MKTRIQLDSMTVQPLLQERSWETLDTVPVSTTDAINAAILAVSEDRVQGFHRDPLSVVSRDSGVGLPVVVERVRAMLRAGTIRRARQTLLATNLAQGALVAWAVPEERLEAAFEYMFRCDPFSGHVVVRSTDQKIAAARYRLWTTLKVPHGYSLSKHCEWLGEKTGATAFKLLPAKCLFVLGVGHVRRRGLRPGSKAEVLAEVQETRSVELSGRDWQVLTALKRDFRPEEIRADLWRGRAVEAGVPLDEFYRVANSLNDRGVIGRFSTFLEHVKPSPWGEQVTRYNALFHWRVAPGQEVEAGREIGRFHIMTHAYWREAGPEFGDVNLMGVAHGTDKAWLLAHKQAIDDHLMACGIMLSYTNVFWGGRSEIKPSEISPQAYAAWCQAEGVDPRSIRI